MTLPRILRCYAEGRPGHWSAICLDLDIAVDGPTLASVTESLEKAVSEYCAYVMTLPEADQRRLLRRKAPLSLRIRFLWHTIRNLWAVHDGGNDPKGRAEFLVPATCRNT